MPHGTTEAEDRHSNFYDAWVNLVAIPTFFIYVVNVALIGVAAVLLIRGPRVTNAA